MPIFNWKLLVPGILWHVKRVLQYSPIPWSSTNDCSLCDLLCSTLWPSKKSSNLSFLWENWVTCKLATGRLGGYCWEEFASYRWLEKILSSQDAKHITKSEDLQLHSYSKKQEGQATTIQGNKSHSSRLVQGYADPQTH